MWPMPRMRDLLAWPLRPVGERLVPSRPETDPAAARRGTSPRPTGRRPDGRNESLGPRVVGATPKHPARVGAGVLAVLDEHLAIDDGAVDPLGQAPHSHSAAREVLHRLDLARGNRVRI